MDPEAFLKAIAASPEDDGPRLVYADWLEEHGDPDRAEFIRAQCALRQLPLGDQRRGPLAARVRDLASRNAGRWLGPLRRYFGSTSLPFVRGFPMALRMSPARFLGKAFQKQAAEWLPRAGVLELSLWGPTARVGKLMESPVLAQIHRLSWRECKLGDAGFQALAGGPYLSNLRELRLEKPYCGMAGLWHLAHSPYLGRLGLLELKGIATGPSPCFGGVGAGVRTLLEDTRLKGLGALGLPGGQLGMGHGPHNRIEDLTRVAGLSRLQALDLSGNLLHRQEAEHLAGCPHLAGLKQLELGYNQIDDEGVNRLLDSPHLKHLEHLGLDGQHHFTHDRTFQGVTEATHRRYRERFGRGIQFAC